MAGCAVESKGRERSPRRKFDFLGLAMEVREMVYRCFVEDLDGSIVEYQTVDVQTNPGIGGPLLRITNVDPAWTSLLGICRVIRLEVTALFWRMSTFKLRPAAIGDLNAFACRGIRSLLLKLVHPNPRAAAYAFNAKQLQDALPQFLRFPFLDEINVCIDAPSLRNCIPIDREGYCEEHKKMIRKSQTLRTLASNLNENHAGYLHFVFHLRDEAMLRTHESVVADFTSLREKGNNYLIPCKDHMLGQCENLTCRMLHAIEEMCQNKWASPSMRRYFIDESTGSWKENTCIWNLVSHLALGVNLMDMKREGSEDPQQSVSVCDLFDVLYLSTTPETAATQSSEDN